MYGWRGKIGLMVVASNLTCEQEMARMCPEGVITFSTRIQFESSPAGLRGLINHVERAAAELSCEDVADVIAFCCTIGSLIEGPGYDERIIKLIRDKAAVPAITTTTAVVQALRHLGIERVAVATPYTREINQIEANALEGYGFQITSMKSIYEDVPAAHFRNVMIGKCTPGDTYRIARSVNTDDAQAVFVSCTNLRAIDVIETLERDLRKPVISSNQAAMWLALRQLGIEEPVQGFGSLLSHR